MTGLPVARVKIFVYVVCSALSALAGILVSVAGIEFAHAQAAKGPSGLPLPRFVSLKAKSVNLRVGPSVDYAVAWRYLKSGVWSNNCRCVAMA